MERLFWIIQLSPKCSDKEAYKEEADGDLTTDRTGHMATEADTELTRQ